MKHNVHEAAYHAVMSSRLHPHVDAEEHYHTAGYILSGLGIASSYAEWTRYHTNALKELKRHLRIYNVKIAAADIEFYNYDEGGKSVFFTLYEDFTEEELEEFLNKLDFTYNAQYCTQYLHGIVWLDNGEWLERRGADATGWTITGYPEMPKRETT